MKAFTTKPVTEKEYAQATAELKYVAAGGAVLLVALNLVIAGFKLATEVKK